MENKSSALKLIGANKLPVGLWSLMPCSKNVKNFLHLLVFRVDHSPNARGFELALNRENFCIFRHLNGLLVSGLQRELPNRLVHFLTSLCKLAKNGTTGYSSNSIINNINCQLGFWSDGLLNTLRG